MRNSESACLIIMEMNNANALKKKLEMVKQMATPSYADIVG